MIYKFIVLGTLTTRRVAHMMKSMKLQPLMPIDRWGRRFDGLNCTVYTELSNKLEDVIIWVKLPLPVPFFLFEYHLYDMLYNCLFHYPTTLASDGAPIRCNFV